MELIHIGRYNREPTGEVPERLKGPVSKTGVRFFRTEGSNPSLSVEYPWNREVFPCFPRVFLRRCFPGLMPLPVSLRIIARHLLRQALRQFAH